MGLFSSQEMLIQKFYNTVFLSRYPKCHELCIQPWNVVKNIRESHTLCIFKFLQYLHFMVLSQISSPLWHLSTLRTESKICLRAIESCLEFFWFKAFTYCASCQKSKQFKNTGHLIFSFSQQSSHLFLWSFNILAGFI